MPTVYEPGDVVIVTTTFATPQGVLADPDTVSYTVWDPSGAIVQTAEWPSGTGVTHVSTGKFSIDTTITVGGDWVIKSEGSGAVKATETARLSVRRVRL